MKSYSHAWRALKHRNFQLFFAGQGLSLIGTWMTRIATGWLVYRLTNSALLLGVVSFASQIVPFVLQPLAGVWVERMDRRKLLIWTQVAACAQALILGFLTLSHVVTIWDIIFLSAFQGLINAFDTPARHSFIVQLVDDKNDLSNAIAINSTMTNGARLIGPALAGLLIAAVGEGWCFMVDGLSYFAVITSLLMMRVNPINMRRHTTTMIEQMKEGWDYVRNYRPIRSILLLFALTALLGSPYMVLMPVIAKEMLHGGPHTLGWLTGASGFGALVSAITLTLRKNVEGLTRMLQVSTIMLASALVFFGLSHTLWVSLIFMAFAGFGLMQTASASNTIIQALVPEDKRARVISYYAMAFYGAAPFGSLFAGVLAGHIGAPNTIILTGVLCALSAFWFSFELPKVELVMAAETL